MAFDQSTRNRLSRFVTDARALLAEEFTRQLQNEYGIDPARGEVVDLAKLGHLDDRQRETARILRETLAHYLAGAAKPGKKARQETLDRIVREQAFTVLNRLCALRMAEARELLIESVGQGYRSKGFQLYSMVAGSALGETGDAYRGYLFSLFDELAVDLGVLFDRFSPQGRLFPRESVLLALLDAINHPEIAPLWAEDETIGWIYQYFNSQEERRQMRAESQAPRNSRELAVRNQFFTPRYVVEFLTDNTLGRIWYEMTQGQTALVDRCRYLVRRPKEIFLAEGETAPEPEAGSEDLSQEELLNQPVFIPFRPIKDPRELLMLDSACGSMHFGLYAFDLFEIIYAEAWERGLIPAADFGLRETAGLDHAGVRLDPERDPTSAYLQATVAFDHAYVVMAERGDFADGVQVGIPYVVDGATRFRVSFAYRVKLSEFDYAGQLAAAAFDPAQGERLVRESGCFDFADLPALDLAGAEANFRRQIPRLIIEHNIHGIDIDPRAVQIAGLSLWLRAQRSWHAQGLHPAQRPTIRRSNIVCAEPMPGDKALLEEFLAELKAERLESLIRQVIAVPGNQRVRATPSMADALADLVRTVWAEMELAGEAGSLLKIEESLAAAIDRGRAEWDQRLPLFRVETFRMTGVGEVERPQVNYLKVVPGEDADFWDRAEALVLAALAAYAAQAEQGHGFTRRLFAGDAARGFAFIDLCRKRYDVALMNPPFGDLGERAADRLSEWYETITDNLICTFIESHERRMAPGGLLGSVIDRTVLIKNSYENFRKNHLLNSSQLMAVVELGWNVLDANVEVACLVVGHGQEHNKDEVFGAALVSQPEKALKLLECCLSPTFLGLQSFRRTPFSAINFETPGFFLRSLSRMPSLSASLGPFFNGHTIKSDVFKRLFWEVSLESHELRIWERMWNGSGYSPLYVPMQEVVLSKRYGGGLINHESTIIRSPDKHGLAGLCYGKRGDYLDIQILPSGFMLTNEGFGGPFDDSPETWFALGSLNSRVAQYTPDVNYVG